MSNKVNLRERVTLKRRLNQKRKRRVKSIKTRKTSIGNIRKIQKIISEMKISNQKYIKEGIKEVIKIKRIVQVTAQAIERVSSRRNDKIPNNQVRQVKEKINQMRGKN